MNKRLARRGITQQLIKGNSVNIPELVSGSSTQAAVQQRPQRQALKMPKQVRQYPYLTRGQGFTLIELLVVVLIIGILAAIALPQYQKAVLKSRMVDAIGMLRTIQKAQEVYYLNHGNYTTDLDDLDIEIPANQKATSFAYSSESYPLRYFYSCHANGFCVAAAQDDNLPIIEVHMMHAFSGNNNQMTCAAFKNNTYNKSNLAEKLCRSMGPVSHTWEGTVYYEIR